jgi:adenylyl-sulfate kinase
MKNTVPHDFSVTKEQRNQSNGHRSFLVWFTGLSGSGKSTIANATEKVLFGKGLKTYILDGDNIREGLNGDLTFSAEDRTENIRRIAEVANLMIDAGVIVLAAFVSPYRTDRENIRKIVGADNFLEIYVSTPIAECERRDIKGLYAKAREGHIENFTGISAPYEAPMEADVEIDTSMISVEEAVALILDRIENKIRL